MSWNRIEPRRLVNGNNRLNDLHAVRREQRPPLHLARKAMSARLVEWREGADQVWSWQALLDVSREISNRVGEPFEIEGSLHGPLDQHIAPVLLVAATAYQLQLARCCQAVWE